MLTAYDSLADIDLAVYVPFGAYGASIVTHSMLWPWRVRHYVQHSTDKLRHHFVSDLHFVSRSWQRVFDQFALRLARTWHTCLPTSKVPARRRSLYTPFSHCGWQRPLVSQNVQAQKMVKKTKIRINKIGKLILQGLDGRYNVCMYYSILDSPHITVLCVWSRSI